MRQAVFVLLLSVGTSAFLFPMTGGGGGGCCCPPPAPPPVACAPPAPACCAPVAPPPPPVAACGGCGGGGGGGGCGGGGGGCGGCGRKKREAANLISFEDISKCNSEELRLLLVENMKKDVPSSLSSIGEKLKEHHDYTLLCSDKKPHFIAEADDYCQVEHEDVHCAIFRVNAKKEATTPAPAAAAEKKESKIDSSAAVKAETQAVTAANDEKKEKVKPEIKKD